MAPLGGLTFRLWLIEFWLVNLLTVFGNHCHHCQDDQLWGETMATMNISLPDPMRDWVQNQIEAGKYSSSSDYVRDLIRRDQASREQQQLMQAAISDGLKSGVSERSMDELLKEAQSRLSAVNEG